MLRRRRASVYLAVAMSAALGLFAPLVADSAVVFAATLDDPPSSEPGTSSTPEDPQLDSAPSEEDQDAGSSASLLGGPSVMSLVTPPDDSGVPIGTGAKPVVTSSMTPAGTIGSGTARTFTIGYENTESSPITNARLWHQLMVGADHDTSFTVSCASTIAGSPAGSCPGWVPAGTETITGGVGGDYHLSFAGVFTFQPLQKLTFTVTVTSTFSAGVCTEDGNATAGGWARYSATGFTDADIDAAASSVGVLSGASVCTPGDITMTNSVTSPYDPSIPAASGQARVLSGDARTFTVTWRNASTTTAYTGVGLRYVYSVPYTGHVTQASWSCTVTGGSQPCPSGLTGSSSIVHSNPGEPSEVVFDVTGVSFPVGQQYTVVVTLATTLNACSDTGEVGARTYAFRSAIGTETSERRASSLTPLPIGCTTWMLNETFSGSGLTDQGWKGLGNACLTAAPSGSTPTNGLGYCSERTNSPTTTFQMPTGTPKGFLQLTDDRGDRVGAVLYNRALPSAEGLVVEFTTYQYGNDAAGADGIGFFLTDGAYELTATGGMGGALGYAYRTSTSWPTEQGAAHGYLGVGLDVYGNFVNPSHTAPECGGSGTSPITQSVGLRGPGNGRTGYCLVAQNRVSSTISKTLDKPSAGIPASGATDYSDKVRDALAAAKRNVRVTVWPLENGATNPRVTVEIQFPGENYYRTVIDATMDSPSPSLIKFGFMAATGGSKQAHLLDAVRVGTVLQMKELNLTKVVDYAANASPTKTTFDVGDVVHYKFVVHNATQAASGISTIYNILVTDPLIPSISCPSTQLARLASMECTGSLTVTAANRDAGRIRNTATVAGSISSDPNAPRNLTDKASVEVPVNPFAPDETRVIQPAGVATFQVIKSGSTLGIVTPDDPSRLRLEVFNPNTSSWVAVPTSGVTSFAGTYGTWRIYPDNRVTFTHNGSTNYTITPLQYRVTNAYGGSAQATLNVTVSVVPWSVCTPAQVRASERYWAFGTASMFDFGTTGTTVGVGTMAGVSSAEGSFTVTDSKGVLQFVVDSSGVIRRSSGTAMTGSPTASTLSGASPSTVFPAGQGTGKYFVVMSSATTTAAGQLRYWMVDMTENGGAGQVTGGNNLGTAVASMAVTSVPNADGTGYWVISPRRGSATVDAYRFSSTGYISAVTTTSSVGTAAAASTTNYEDIRFNADLTRVAMLASNNGNSSGTHRVRLMSFNAATGVPALVGQNTFTRSGSSAHGYSVEFSPNGAYLFASRMGTGTTVGTVFVATVNASALGAFGSAASAPSGNRGGAIRAGGDERLYWAQSGNSSQIRVLSSPNTGSTSSTTQNLASGAASTYGLSNTLSDCAVPPAEFLLEKYNGNGVLTSGATFALYPDAGGSAGTVAVSPGIVSTGTGTYKASGIAPGSYWIRETTTLTGHSLLPQDILIVVTLGGAIQLDAVPNPQVQLVNASGVYTLKITNDPALSLPLVGGPGTAWLLGSGVVLVLVAILGAWWWRRRRDRRT
ncbi:MAG: hypothetical protein J0H23_11035 [Micrococcales bacterium]|nr:hypothetical protein [Micrococcales bacterium]OJX69499.1 MAG: hypothetical protein BGO94_13385 [Micrococcales bacterium 72-143]